MIVNFELERKNLVQHLIAQGVLRTPSVIRAMGLVHREEFVPHELREHAYVDSPLPIESGQTISAPQDR